MGADEVRQRLLDSAERLFSEQGYHGASLRDITRLAGVRLAAVNHHFGSKEQLFREVVVRRATELNADRLHRLECIDSGTSRPQRVEGIVRAFVLPATERAERDRGWQSYLTLLAQSASNRNLVVKMMTPHFSRLGRTFIGAIVDTYGLSVPGVGAEAYQFMLSCTLHACSDTGRRGVLAKARAIGRDKPAPVEIALVKFVVAGMDAVCESSLRD